MQKNSIKQKQILKQKLSHQNIQLFKMMELNLLQFDQKVKEELEINPAIENINANEENMLKSINSSISDAEAKKRENEDFFNQNNSITISSDVQNYQQTHLSHKENNYNEEDDRDLYIPIEDNDTFLSNLLNQLKYQPLTDDQKVIGEYIIGSLDDDGYLRRSISNIVDDLSFRQNVITTEAEVKVVLEAIQDLDPAGIAASHLQECLLLQLYRKKYSKTIENTITVIEKMFELYSKKQYNKIIQKLKITEEEFQFINKEILSLNPKPTDKNISENLIGKYVIPDFFIYNNEGKLELELHSYNQPNLAISPEFAEMLKKLKDDEKKSSAEIEAQEYIADKINKATLFISLVKERQETMIIIMNAILDMQKEFFLTGDEAYLKPMALKHIAARTNFDISTVSRVTSSKYIQTEYGILSLKFFFSEGIMGSDGEEVSNKVIMKKLEEIIAEEDKENPFSDDQLTIELKKYGFQIARRTTAKYRENLNISPKHIRKQTTIK